MASQSGLQRAALCVALFLVVWPTSLRAEDPFPPRPISEAEHAAVTAVLAFLDGGPDAVLARLAADSPMREISASHALDEIAVRMGSPEGSTWALQTPGRMFEDRSDLAIFRVEFASGLDDVILMDMARENSSWVVHQVRCAVDPRMPRETAEDEMHRFFERVSDETAAAVPPRPAADPLSPADPLASRWIWVVLPVALALGVALLSGRRRHVTAFGLLAAAIVAGGCGLFLDGEEEVEKVPYVELDALDLAPLLPLRQALTADRSRGEEQRAELQVEVAELVTELAGTLDPTDQVSVAARVWHAQLLVLHGDLGPAAQILKAIPLPDSLPLAAVVRGRLAAQRREPSTAEHYENARKLGPDHDGLTLEAAWAAYAVGDAGAMERHMRSQVYMGSRDAIGYYYASTFDAVQGQATAAAELFQSAWAREPLSRFAVLREPLLTQSSRHRDVFELLDFTHAGPTESGATESVTSAPPTRPLEIPTGSTSHILGRHLAVEMGEPGESNARSLRIPGGGGFLPEGTVVESPERRVDREAGAALARFDELTIEMTTGAPLRPTDREAIDALSHSLLRRQQWRTLIRLTDPLASRPELVPPSLMQNRALALLRTGRSAAAEKLLAELARDDQIARPRPPMTYYQLGELLVEAGRYDLALRATKRAAGLGEHEFITTRQKQIQLMKALHQDTSAFTSRHFRMVYPAPASESYPRQLSWVMEAEWDRIGTRVPVRGSHKSEVHVVPHGLYTEAYGKVGSRAAGLYDGTPRVPFAEFETFQEDFIRTLTHQTAHAMIDRATGERAPRWFHEGLARHVEMHQRDENPMPDLHERGRVLSIRTLDPILEGWVDSQLADTAYAHATWAVRYIETRRGVAGLHRMLAAYRSGSDTPGALRKAVGTSVHQFDRDFREWSIRQAPAVWRSEVVSYLDQFAEEKKRQALDQLQTEKDKQLAAADPRELDAKLQRAMREWHADYQQAVRPVKAALAKSIPLIQGQADGDVEAACRELRGEIDRFLGNRQNLAAPDPEVAEALQQAYGSFLDMTQHCRSRRWNDMRSELQRAVQGLGQAKQTMQPYGWQP